jgi:hypothetical protein
VAESAEAEAALEAEVRLALPLVRPSVDPQGAQGKGDAEAEAALVEALATGAEDPSASASAAGSDGSDGDGGDGGDGSGGCDRARCC